MKLKFWAAIGLLTAATLYSCDDETTGIGQFVADEDFILAKSDSYTVSTTTVVIFWTPRKSSSQRLPRPI